MSGKPHSKTSSPDNKVKKKVEEHSYRNLIDLEEEISHLNKFIVDKEDELAQV